VRRQLTCHLLGVLGADVLIVFMIEAQGRPS
jgi:hypothetical protein